MVAQLNQAQAQSQQILIPVVTALRQGLGGNLVSVVLYGSRAREDATASSDWDLLVIARNLPSSFFHRHLQLKKCLPAGWRGWASLLAYTPTEFETRVTSLMLDIALDGVVLDDPGGYATAKLALLRRLIEIKGLYRKQQGKDFIWSWNLFPGPDWSVEWDEVQ
jgi:predicted nucleotidyltransferase